MYISSLYTILRIRGPFYVFRSPSDGDLMIPPWTFCDVLGKRLLSFFIKNKNVFLFLRA